MLLHCKLNNTGSPSILPRLLSPKQCLEDLRSVSMEAVQRILLAGANIVEATQLDNDMSLLRTSLPRAQVLIDRAEWGRFNSKELAVLLSQLKDTTHDAEDLLREFDDQVLQQNMEEANRSRAGRLFSSSLNLAKHLLSGSKTRVKEAQSKLDKILAEIEGMLNFMGLNVEPLQLGKPFMPETSSVISEPMVFGRDKERNQIIKLFGVPPTKCRSAKRIKGDNSRAKHVVDGEIACMEDVTILPIVGIGGVGKTTLAQLVYNDSRVKTHFEMRMWVCVSDLFDIRRITKEIIECLCPETSCSLASLNALQVELRKQLKEHKFLLVLDDVWPNANQEWQRFSAPLRCGRQGSMILVTTRSLKVANLVAAVKPVTLKGLPSDIFWEFFKKCAFGKEHPESYPHLQDIGKSIASRLCGSPLAAKTLGRLLNMELTEQHWITVQNSELWELQHEENEILPALQLSYLYLPQELKRCFAFCSIFQKDYSFQRDEIVDIWVAQGFVTQGGSMRIEDTGSKYLDDLRSRFLFQADPKFPGRYVMHDLIHDMAQSVSVDECFLMQDFGYQNRRIIPSTVRHMSIEVDSGALDTVAVLNHLNKLHSLRLGARFEVDFSWFNQLSNVLFLSLKGCKLVNLPEDICNLTHLRHLDISHSSIQTLPEKFRRLSSLQVFDASHSSLQTIHQDVTKLVNLCGLALPPKCSQKLSTVRGIGNLSSLRNLTYFTVGRVNGRRISELQHMNQLSGTLTIRSVRNIRSGEEAAEARLFDKQYLRGLVLLWRSDRCRLRAADNEVLEALCPSRIAHLKFGGFGGDVLPSWFKQGNLPTLRILEICGSSFLRCLSIPFHSLEHLVLFGLSIEELNTSVEGIPACSTGDDRTHRASSSNSSNGLTCIHLTSLTTLVLCTCDRLINLDQFLSPEYLPSIKSIDICDCENLVSLPVHKFVSFVCLQDLKIRGCWKLVCPREMVLPHSIQRLEVWNCGKLDKSFPGCLENLPSLTLLHLRSCRNLDIIPLNSINTNKLTCLVLRFCSKLSSIGGLHALSSIQHVEISNCPELTEVHQPLLKKGLRTKGERELLKFIQEYWSYKMLSLDDLQTIH